MSVKDNFKICRDSKNRKLLTKSEHKVYGFDKRVLRANIYTDFKLHHILLVLHGEIEIVHVYL